MARRNRYYFWNNFLINANCLLFYAMFQSSEAVTSFSLSKTGIVHIPTCYIASVSQRWLCIKVGRGQGDGDIGTRVWGLGTWGCGDVWDRDAGMWMMIAKVAGECDISFFVKMCYLRSTLDSIFQNHTGHLMMFTQNISFSWLGLGLISTVA